MAVEGDKFLLWLIFLRRDMVMNRKSKVAKYKKNAAKNVSMFGIFVAMIFFAIGIVCLNYGYTNIGPVFLLFGGLWTFLALLPLWDVNRFIIAGVSIGAMILALVLVVPYIEAAITDAIQMVKDEFFEFDFWDLIPDIFP